MWTRRKEEETPSKQSYSPSSQTESSKEGIPMSTMPSRQEPEPYRPSSAASIGKSVMIKGQILSREDLYLDGELEGTVELQEHRLTIGPNGRVQANIKAREICVIGTIHGNVEATDKLEIRKEAKLIGDIRTARIVIEDGAYFKGSIDIIKADVSKSPPKEAPRQMAATASGPATVASGEMKR
ncbi:MAG: polymer-forming cytoskeletal protein [Acidobacteria bacterium]|nr:polymer-forming cytoskeletal protein [Acidobacteriota bacterium]